MYWLLVAVFLWAVAIHFLRREITAAWAEPCLRHPVMVFEGDDWGYGPLEQADALRDIAAGEEITYDYGFEFDVPYTKELKEIWACRCGSPKCIGTMLKPKAGKSAKSSAKKSATKAKKASVK